MEELNMNLMQFRYHSAAILSKSAGLSEDDAAHGSAGVSLGDALDRLAKDFRNVLASAKNRPFKTVVRLKDAPQDALDLTVRPNRVTLTLDRQLSKQVYEFDPVNPRLSYNGAPVTKGNECRRFCRLLSMITKTAAAGKSRIEWLDS